MLNRPRSRFVLVGAVAMISMICAVALLGGEQTAPNQVRRVEAMPAETRATTKVPVDIGEPASADAVPVELGEGITLDRDDYDRSQAGTPEVSGIAVFASTATGQVPEVTLGTARTEDRAPEVDLGPARTEDRDPEVPTTVPTTTVPTNPGPTDPTPADPGDDDVVPGGDDGVEPPATPDDLCEQLLVWWVDTVNWSERNAEDAEAWHTANADASEEWHTANADAFDAWVRSNFGL